MNLESDLQRNLEEAGQQHLIEHFAGLEERRQERLQRQLASIDLALVARLRRGEGLASPATGQLEPMPCVPLAHRGPGSAAADRGVEMLRRGHVAFAVLAGGQASRLKLEAPKGTYPIGPRTDRSLFRILCEHVLRASKDHGRLPPLAVTTSSTTDAATRAFFERQNCFGLDRGKLHFACQASLPALDDDGKMILASSDRVFTSPDGHGGAVEVLETSGILERWEDLGIETVCTFQVDNPLLHVVDPDFLGRLTGAAPIVTKIVPKTDPAEKVGILARRDGRPAIVEYSELPDDLAQARDDEGRLAYRLGSIAVHAFRLDFLRRVLARTLPLHPARKEIPVAVREGFGGPTHGIKYERFLFDLFPAAEDVVAVEVDRDREFAPLKNADGPDSPDTVRAALEAEYRRWYAEAGTEPPEGEGPLELSPLDVLGPDDLRPM